MRDLFVALVVFGALPFILMRPYIGILVWSWLGYMNPHRLTWGFAYDFPFAAIVGGVTLVSLLFSKESKRIPWSREVVVLLLFITWMTVTSFFSLVPQVSWLQWEKVMKIQLVVLLTLITFQDRERLHLLLWVIVLSLAFYGIKGGIFTILTGGNYRVWGPEGSFIGGNNELALALIMILPLMYYLKIYVQNKWIRLGLLAGLLLTGLAVLASYSRGAFVTVAVMALVIALKSKSRLAFVLLMVIAVPVVFTFMPQHWFDRMGTIQTYEKDSSAMGRINAWHFAFNLAKDRPLVGGGFNTFNKTLFLSYAPDPEDFHDAHSIYFEVLGEHGFVGLGLFLLLLLFSYLTCNRLKRLTQDNSELKWANDLATMLQYSIIGYIVGGVFLGLAYFDLIYHIIIIAVLLSHIVGVELSKHVLVQPDISQKSYNRLDIGNSSG